MNSSLKAAGAAGPVGFAAHFLRVGCLAQHMNSRSFGNIKSALVTSRQPSAPSVSVPRSGSSFSRSGVCAHCPFTKYANLRFQPISLIQYCRRVIPSGFLKLAQLKHCNLWHQLASFIIDNKQLFICSYLTKF